MNSLEDRILELERKSTSTSAILQTQTNIIGALLRFMNNHLGSSEETGRRLDEMLEWLSSEAKGLSNSPVDQQQQE